MEFVAPDGVANFILMVTRAMKKALLGSGDDSTTITNKKKGNIQESYKTIKPTTFKVVTC